MNIWIVNRFSNSNSAPGIGIEEFPVHHRINSWIEQIICLTEAMRPTIPRWSNRIAPLPLHQLIHHLHRDFGLNLPTRSMGLDRLSKGEDLIDPRNQIGGRSGIVRPFSTQRSEATTPTAAQVMTPTGYRGEGEGGEGCRKVEEVHRLLRNDDPACARRRRRPEVGSERPRMARGGAVPGLRASPLSITTGFFFPTRRADSKKRGRS